MLANLRALDFPAQRLRQLINKLDNTRIFIRSGRLLYVILDFFNKLVGRHTPLDENYGSFYNLPSHLVRVSGNRALQNGRMFQNRAFDLKRTDTVARALNDVVGAPDKAEIPRNVTPRNIPRVINTTLKTVRDDFSVNEIPLEKPDNRRFIDVSYNNLTLVADRNRIAVLINKVDVIKRRRFAHRTGNRLIPPKIRKHYA